MSESLDYHPDVNVQDAEYFRLLGYPRGHIPGDRALELAAWARDWFQQHGRPWTYMRRVELLVTHDTLLLDNLQFHSRSLHEHLLNHDARSAMLFAVSAGQECERHARELWDEGKPDEYFFLEVFGSAVVEDLVARTNGRICDLAGIHDLMAVPHYSPGYDGWDVADQQKLFGLIAEGMTGCFPGPIEVLSSGMLRPKKSMLAVFGLAPAKGNASSHASTPCERCSFSPCQFRRAPYRHRAEPLRELVGFASEEQSDAAAAPLTLNARYSVNTRALRKWAAERVRLTACIDGSIEAVFRFDGTTCSNMGRPLAFDYRVLLSRTDEGCRILEMTCSPAPGDRGYESTCAFLSDPDKHLHDLAADKPLLGRPLDDVLAWKRNSESSGCHCSAESRIHKWGLALEAIHFALLHSRVPQRVS